MTYSGEFILGLSGIGEEVDEDDLDERLAALQAWQFVTRRDVEGKTRYEIDPLVIGRWARTMTRAARTTITTRRWRGSTIKRQDYYGLDVESANLEAAFEWAMQTDAEDALWLFNACRYFLSNRGRFAQRMESGSSGVDAALAGLEALQTTLRANAQNSLGATYQEIPLVSAART